MGHWARSVAFVDSEGRDWALTSADSDLAMAATDSVADSAVDFDSAMTQAYSDSAMAMKQEGSAATWVPAADRAQP